MAEEKKIGTISHYFGKINVGIIELTDSLKLGDRLHFKGKKTDFEQEVSSMQLEHQNISEAQPGTSIGIKVEQKVREGDEVYKISS